MVSVHHVYVAFAVLTVCAAVGCPQNEGSDVDGDGAGGVVGGAGPNERDQGQDATYRADGPPNSVSSGATGTALETCTTFGPDTFEVRPDDARSFARASRAASSVLAGAWPASAPSPDALRAAYGPRIGPPGGRTFGRLAGGQLDLWHLPPHDPAAKPVHVVAVVDLGASIRAEIPLLVGALEALASSLDQGGDKLSVVEWSDEPAVQLEAVDGAAAGAAVTAYGGALRQRAQFGGEPPLSVVSDRVQGLVDLGGDAHVVLFTDGTMSATDPGFAETVARWGKTAEVSIVELQVYETSGVAGPLALHEALLGDRSLTVAGLYVGGGLALEPAPSPNARLLSDAPEHRWWVDFVFRERFDEYFRRGLPDIHLRLETSSALEIVGAVAASDEAEAAVGKGRWGKNGPLFARLDAASECLPLASMLHVVDGAGIELAAIQLEVAAAAPEPYEQLLAGLDVAEAAFATQSCDAQDVAGARAALEGASTAALDGFAEAPAFEVNRRGVIDLLTRVESLCGQ